ncbi:MAG: DUF4065 domain-containing protein [Planctomycetes bacterium]|nr:DUF4065 domain-containing protein [Planctomycetota bacterium]
MSKPHSRVAEAAMAILQAAPDRRLGFSVLNRTLFYADLCALRDLGKPITGSDFVALPQGPVLRDCARVLVEELDRAGLAEQVVEGQENAVIARGEIAEFTLLSSEEVGIVRLVARTIHGRTAAWVSEYSHENEAWQVAFRAGTGSKIDRILAMQQVVEEDPWVGEPPDGTVEACMEASATENGVPLGS